MKILKFSSPKNQLSNQPISSYQPRTISSPNRDQMHFPVLKFWVLLLLLLPLGLNTARATDYVFSVSGGYLGVNSNGQIALISSNDFSESCVWHCTSNANATPTAASLDNNTSRYLYTTVDNTKYWLQGSNSDGTAVTVTTTAPSDARWRNYNNRLYWRQSSTYYLYYRSSAWRTSKTEKKSDTTGYKSNNGGTDYRSTTGFGFAGFYKIKNVQSSTYYLAVSNNNYQTGKPYLNTKQNPDDECVWYIEPTSGGYYHIIHAQDCKRVVTNYTSDQDHQQVVHLEATNTGSVYNISNYNGDNFNIFQQNYSNRSFNTWNGGGGDIGWYDKNDNGSKWIFEPATFTLSAPTIAFDNTTNKVSITNSNNGGSIYYSIDSPNPTDASTTYSAPFVQNTPATIYAIVANCVAQSSVASLQITKVATPTINQNGSSIEITCSTAGATIYYKTSENGSYSQYTAPLSTSGIGAIWVYAQKNNCINSDVATRAFTNPTAISITSANPMTMYVGQTGTITYELTPNQCYNNVEFTSSNSQIATVAAGGIVTGVAIGQTSITANAKNFDGTTAASATITINVRDKVVTPVITFAPTASDDGATATTTITCATDDVTIYYKINDGTQQTYSTSFVVNDNDVVKAWAVKNNDTDDNYDDSEENTQTYVSCKLPTPTISVTSGGVSFSCSNPDATIRYTTDGSNPTESSTAWNGTTITTLADGATIKAIATSSDCGTSDIATATNHKSGVSGGVVTLNDLEDHNWAYYKGREGVKVGTADNAPDYNDKYKYTLYMPDPRNVKITYRGYNTSNSTIMLGDNTVNISTLNSGTAPHVSPVDGEGQNTFVYYKTLEKFVIGYFTDNADWNGIPDNPDNTAEQYPYTVISNPFSVRPSTGSGTKTYYGFGGWKIVSGGAYIQGHRDGDVLNLDELIHFTNLNNNYTPNCISGEIVLEATWKTATIWEGSAAHSFIGGTYETNFIYINTNTAVNAFTQSSPCTIIGMYPDGTNDYSGSRTLNGLTVNTTSATDPYDRSNCVKVEWIKHGNGTFDANGRNMTMGRGIVSSSGGAQGNVYGNNTANQNVVNTVKVESGYYSGIANINNKGANATNVINSYVIMGCDYDRALANYYVPADQINNNSYNIKLRASRIYGPNGTPDLHRANGQLYMRSLIKSGVFASEIGNEYYFHAYQRPGQRYIEMEGGYNKGHIKGGSDGGTSQGRVRAMSVRMKGGRIDGQIACGSTSTFCSGDRMIVITGGRIGGWIAPGSNCSSTGSGNTGKTDGTSYVYFGGTAEINSRQFGSSGNDLFSQSTGGVIYGAGLGYNPSDNTGEMTLGSNIVFADEAYTERGIYGGGAIGQTKTAANIFILGGRVGTGTGKVKDQGANTTYTVDAGVYGGACDRGGDSSFIYMDGGIVESGIYGGANINGTMTGNTNVRIVGGQVGTSTTSANVHGGGYGASTVVSGNVDVTLGTRNSSTGETAGSAVIYGDVYGGSALGKVNGTSSSSYHTNVTLNAGTINGSLYGGGLGDNNTAADVYGSVAVNVYGGSVKKTDENGANGSGAVYGCNNINGAPQGDVSVDIFGTDPAPAEGEYALFSVYGGGNKANYNDSPAVTIHNCDNSIEYVYGGGNAAAVLGTIVTIYGGNKIGNVFGGGNGISGTAADVTRDGTSVLILGGTIGNVFGGSNSRGEITGDINVQIYPSAACPMDIENVYGGGNMAPSQAGKLDIKCGDNLTYDFHIGNVYGGANAANITSGNIVLNINSGNIDNVFGGNNTSGTISGTITVNIEEADQSCGMEVGYVYGGGNLALYSAPNATKDYPQVNIIKGTVTHDVFGGGKGDGTEKGKVTGNPKVSMTGGHIKGNVYGGGSSAPVEGSTSITITGPSIVDQNVYGGGLGGVVTGNTSVQLGEQPE